jgi:hypothetical protein
MYLQYFETVIWNNHVEAQLRENKAVVLDDNHVEWIYRAIYSFMYCATDVLYEFLTGGVLDL